MALTTPLLVIALYILIIVLHILVPIGYTEGYCVDPDKSFTPLRYRLNGIYVFLLVTIFYSLIERYVWHATPLYTDFWVSFLTANVTGVAVSIFFFVRGGREKYARAITKDQVKGKVLKVALAPAKEAPAATKFFLGHEWNPRFFGIDVKMTLYLIGAALLQCNILSAMFAQELALGYTTTAMKTYVAMFLWFLIEYCLGEEVHLYTYDLFAEKLGFKLAWGCLAFYPYAYAIGVYPIAASAAGVDISPQIAFLCGIIFLGGWICTRGANMQKFYFRVHPERKTFLCGLVKQEALPGTSILTSGWWGAARHLNYFGEILQAVALAIPGYMVAPTPWLSLVPILYPVYYVALFVPRQIDDDAVCEKKYGEEIWGQYCRRVPYRIIPYIY